jgi:hypothetical protein
MNPENHRATHRNSQSRSRRRRLNATEQMCHLDSKLATAEQALQLRGINERRPIACGDFVCPASAGATDQRHAQQIGTRCGIMIRGEGQHVRILPPLLLEDKGLAATRVLSAGMGQAKAPLVSEWRHLYNQTPSPLVYRGVSRISGCAWGVLPGGP